MARPAKVRRVLDGIDARPVVHKRRAYAAMHWTLRGGLTPCIAARARCCWGGSPDISAPAGQFYCHYEAAEVTTPFAIEPGLTFAAVIDIFCAKYNAKHSARPGAFLLHVHLARFDFLRARARGVRAPRRRPCRPAACARGRADARGGWQVGSWRLSTSSSRLAARRWCRATR